MHSKPNRSYDAIDPEVNEVIKQKPKFMPFLEQNKMGTKHAFEYMRYQN